MDKILFLNEKDRNTGLSLEHSDYRYKTAKPVAATKQSHYHGSHRQTEEGEQSSHIENDVAHLAHGLVDYNGETVLQCSRDARSHSPS